MGDVSSTLLVAVVMPSRIRTDEPWSVERTGGAHSARHYPVFTQSPPIAPIRIRPANPTKLH